MNYEKSGYELMRHALGVQPYRFHRSKGGVRFKKPYRNYFYAGGPAIQIWNDLVVKGFAVKASDNHVYYVTDAGREAALAGLTFKRQWGYGTLKNH